MAMRLNPKAKMAVDENGKHRIEKWIVREAFKDYLPDEIVWRQKEQFSDGVGYSWIDTLKKLTDEEVSDTQFALADKRFPINTPATKEEYYYRSIFARHFPSESAAKCVPHEASVACSTAKALEWAGAADLADRSVRELSGGQRQKVYLAMALAQDTDLILLDEPTTYLDPGRQFELLDLIASLPGRGKTVVMVLHDLSHALRYSTQLLLLEQGRLVQRGTPEELYAGGQLDRVFGIRSRRAPDGSYYFLPPFA